MQSNIPSQSHTYIIQACYDLSINTLRLDSTHPNTYNLVGFSGCWHLWWIPLLTPELCVTSVTMNKFPSRTRLTLNEFQASCYSHHKSQSTLSEINWLLRVSGCNPYLVPSYIDRAPPWTPTNRGHGITSRPLKHDPEVSPRDLWIYVLTTYHIYSNNQIILIMH